MILLLIAASVLATVPSRAQTVENDYTETVACENGTFGALSVGDTGFYTYAAGSFMRSSDCASRNTFSRIPMGQCRIRNRRGTTLPPQYPGTPSPTTPVISLLDVGPDITLRGPRGEVVLNRDVQGPNTQYATPLPRLTAPALPAAPFVVAGRYSVSWAGGRDLGAFQGEFDFEPLVLKTPVNGAAISGDRPVTLTWSGGDFAIVDELMVNASVTSGVETYDINCRIANGKDGSFTFPEGIWSQLPATLRASGAATLQLGSTSTLAVPHPDLESGLRVVIPHSSFVLVRFAPQ